MGVYNQLTSLEYCPKIVNGHFDCSNNQLTSLDHLPKGIEFLRCDEYLIGSTEYKRWEMEVYLRKHKC